MQGGGEEEEEEEEKWWMLGAAARAHIVCAAILKTGCERLRRGRAVPHATLRERGKRFKWEGGRGGVRGGTAAQNACSVVKTVAGSCM
jgi:hypothetical protein